MKYDQGRVHSLETFSTVDGPGIRSVIFLQGCPLRCQYCHNPDTWQIDGGEEKSAVEMIDLLRRYREYYDASGGGVTISGGEPCLQHEFTRSLIKECKKCGLHVALDTSGWTSESVLDELLPEVDLVILDIKQIDPIKHKQLTGKDNAPVLKAARQITRLGIPLWIRHVLVPGVTDQTVDMIKLAEFMQQLTTMERLEILPYHNLGEHKWKHLGLDYKLTGLKQPGKEHLAEVINLFQSYGLPVENTAETDSRNMY